MKLYKLLRAMDNRQSDRWDDYKNIEIAYVKDGDCEIVPNTLRSILRFADMKVISVDAEMRDERTPMIVITIAEEDEGEPSLDLLRYKHHLCK